MTVEPSPPARAPEQPGGRQLENVSLLMAGVGLVVGTVVGLVALRGLTPFEGDGWSSVSFLASASTAALSGVATLVVLAFFGGRIVPWYGRVHRARRWLMAAGLTLMMGTLGFFVVRALNSVVDAAFFGLRFDMWSGTAYIATVCASGAYVVASVIGRLSTSVLSVLVSVFLVLGAVLSAVNTSNQLWWQVHFSQLGMTPDLAGFAFNYTLALTGLVIVTLADFLTHDMQRWLAATGQGRWKALVVRLGLVGMGSMLSGVGLIPVTLSHGGHLVATYGAVASFVFLAAVAPMILRGIPWGFRWASVAILGVVGLLAYLFKGVGRLGTTGFEMFAVGLALLWMVLFIRTIVAAARDVPELALAAPEATAEPGVGDRG